MHVTLTDVTDSRQVYDGTLCSMVSSMSGQGSTTRPPHAGVGRQLGDAPRAGASVLYRLVLQPSDAAQGLPLAAQDARTSVNLVFTGFDY